MFYDSATYSIRGLFVWLSVLDETNFADCYTSSMIHDLLPAISYITPLNCFKHDKQRHAMHESILKKLEQKIQDTLSNRDDIQQLIQSLSGIDDSASFARGIVIGRIYNAFYYQSKRILSREPTQQEFTEFLEFLKHRQNDLDNLW